MMPPSACIRRRPSLGAGGAQGFTVIELLVVMVLLGTLMVVGAPSFMEARRNATLSDAVSDLALATGTARSAALKTGRTAYVQANDTSVGWSSGWFVYIDNNWNQAFDSGTDEVVLQREALATEITVTPTASTPFAAGYVLFDANGFPKLKSGASGQGAMVMAVTGRSTTVIVDTSGRLRSCKTGAAGCSAI